MFTRYVLFVGNQTLLTSTPPVSSVNARIVTTSNVPCPVHGWRLWLPCEKRNVAIQGFHQKRLDEANQRIYNPVVNVLVPVEVTGMLVPVQSGYGQFSWSPKVCSVVEHHGIELDTPRRAANKS